MTHAGPPTNRDGLGSTADMGPRWAADPADTAQQAERWLMLPGVPELIADMRRRGSDAEAIAQAIRKRVRELEYRRTVVRAVLKKR